MRTSFLAFPLLAALGVSCGVTVALVQVFNYFIGPMSKDLHLTRAVLSGALSVYIAVLILALPIAGFAADRFGARLVILTSGPLFGLGLLWIARSSGSISALYAAFGLTALLGAGASPVTYARVIVHRFKRFRGLALGIALSGGGLGAIVLPPLVRPAIVSGGWRAGFLALALLVTVVALIVGAFASEGLKSQRHSSSEEGDSLRLAAATGTFWAMTAAFTCLGFVLAGVVSHLTEIWAALGLATNQVPHFQAAVGGATIVGRLAGGAAMDRIPAKYVGTAAALMGSLGVLLLALHQTTALDLFVVAVGFGLCTGTESDVVSFLSSHYFGLKHFGRIYAAQAAFFLAGYAAGPVTFAIAAERVGVSRLLLGGALVFLLSGILLMTLKTRGRSIDVFDRVVVG